MANVLFSRTSDPSSKPITDGQLIFDTSGNGKMYLDVGSKRMEMGGARTIDPVLNSSSENPIQNKAVAGVMLDNMTDVNAVTGSGFLPDALSIKELDTDLQGQINTLNSNLEKHKNITRTKYGTISASSTVEWHSITLTFKDIETISGAVAIQQFANQSQKAIALLNMSGNQAEFGYYGSLSADLQIIAIATGSAK